MKKRWRILIPCFLLLLVILGAVVFMSGKTFSTGRCLKTQSGACLIFMEDQAPIVMHDKTHGQSLFKDLTTGDEIRILRNDWIAESYPGQVNVYMCKKLADGTAEHLPQDTLASLADMGWVAAEEDT